MLRKSLAALLSLAACSQVALAADHGDSPISAQDQAMDIADVYTFLDPNNNANLIIGMTFRGFITPGEAVNFGFFDELANYRFDLETTGDAKPDLAINVKFTKRLGTTVPQTALISLPFGKRIRATTTLPTLSGTANTPVVTTDPATGISFFAGEVDDPFFFDIPGFNRFIASIRAGSPDTTLLGRGRDTFAGYNVNAIALSIPVSFLKLKPSATGNVIGVNGQAQRRVNTAIGSKGLKSIGSYKTIDRMGNPGLNVVVIPYARKNEYNFASPQDDAKGKFAKDVVSTLQALGANADSINTLASVYVAKGDYLRVNTSIPNTGPTGGTVSGAGFPNGRRLGDDIIDTFLTIVANGTTLGDGVNASDVSPRDVFPFFAAPQQPQVTGVTDDNTRN